MITTIDQTKCTGCGICEEACPLDAIRLNTITEDISPCRAYCPAGIDIRTIMYMLKQGNYQQAFACLKENNPLPAITGRVCFHPCESNCIRKDIDQALNINSIERFLADHFLFEKPGKTYRLHAAKVGVIGSGPAGLSAAYYLVKLGYKVAVFESMPKIGGMLRYGIPAYRLPKDILDVQVGYFKRHGIKFYTRTSLGSDITLDLLMENGYKAICIAIGSQLSNQISIEGINSKRVWWGLEFLKDINTSGKLKPKGQTVVIGGGDVAFDVALSALRLGSKKVSIVCLESEAELPAHKEYVQQAIDEGIDIRFSWGPRRLDCTGSELNSIELVRCICVFDKNKVFNPSYDNKTTTVMKADTVIIAVGQRADTTCLKGIVNLRDDGTIIADPDSLQTSLSNVFASGDVASGPSSVVDAIFSGRKAAISIDAYLRGQDPKISASRKQIGKTPKEGIVKKSRYSTPLLPVGERKNNFKEVKLKFNNCMTMDEAGRCLTCSSQARICYPEDCMSCFRCELGCPSNAIYVHPFKEVLPLAIKY